MKKIFATLSFLVVLAIGAAAQSPVSWSFSSKKIDDKTYELHLTAAIQGGWHLYAQKQPADAIAQPTTFAFNKSPLLNFEGKVKESGKLEKYTDKVLNVSANQYSNRVDFVQVVKLKAKAKTAVTGTLEYQTCNDEKCLPPKSVPFTIALN
ncbi:protein-disulfide reductase DsbD domain-containing protein [Flaviaesturariibacter amylovorans]|uniref:Thiol:disulfide interchange protein DsbD N-terminal domain-containing protein n=1 Tax=Flaviaesturariibacter amylovorans TaxID=1084520 RepID=A0ABP8HE49_9BACT